MWQNSVKKVVWLYETHPLHKRKSVSVYEVVWKLHFLQTTDVSGSRRDGRRCVVCWLSTIENSHKGNCFDIMFTRFRTNSTQIDTSRQCMLKQIHVTTKGHVFLIISQWLQQVPLLCQMLSYCVSVDSYQHQRSSRFVFNFLILNFYQHFFVSTFPSVYVDSIIFTT